MSLSQIPATIADRPAADVRAVHRAVKPEYADITGQDTTGVAFAKLLGSVEQAKTVPVITEPIPVPPVETTEITASSDPTLAPSKDDSDVAALLGDIYPALAPQTLPDAVDPAPVATLAGPMSAEQPESGRAGLGAGLAQSYLAVPISSFGPPRAIGTSLPTNGPIEPGQPRPLHRGIESPVVVSPAALSDPSSRPENGWNVLASDSQSTSDKVPRENLDSPDGATAPGASHLPAQSTQNIGLLTSMPTPQPMTGQSLRSMAKADEAKIGTASFGGAEPKTSAKVRSDIVATRLPISTEQSVRPPVARLLTSELPAGDTAETTTASQQAVRPGHPQLFAAYAAMTKPVERLTNERPSVASDPIIAGQTKTTATTQPNAISLARALVHSEPNTDWSRHAIRFPIDDVAKSRQLETGTGLQRPVVATKPAFQGFQVAPAEVLTTEPSGTTPHLTNLQHAEPDPFAADPAQPSTPHNRSTALHVASQLAQVAGQTTNGTTDITLNPKELGQVKLSLQVIDGTMFVAIAAERPETAELMRRNIDSLVQEFRGLGYQDVSFSFAGRQGGNGPGPDPGFGQPGNPEPAQLTDTSADLPADRYIPRRAAAQTGGTGLDLRL